MEMSIFVYKYFSKEIQICMKNTCNVNIIAIFLGASFMLWAVWMFAMVNKQTKNQQPTLDHQKQLPRTIHIPETNPPFWPYVHDQRPTRFASYNAYPWKRQNKRSKHSEWKNGLIAMRHEADDPFRVQSFPPLLLARRYAHFRLLPISREAQISSVCLRFHSKTHYYYYGGTRLGSRGGVDEPLLLRLAILPAALAYHIPHAKRHGRPVLCVRKRKRFYYPFAEVAIATRRKLNKKQLVYDR